MMCEAHMCDVLAAHEIDTAFIDHSLSYHENCNNLYNQFGVRFRQRDYNKEYRRYQDMAENIEVLKPSSLVLPFDPIKRAKDIESIVMRGDKRSYYRVRFAERFDCPVTVDSVGCCLSCAYCWNGIRNEQMKLGKFYSPAEIAGKAIELAVQHKRWDVRVSGCEAILGEASTRHFSAFIQALKDAKKERGKKKLNVLLETNGIMLGYDKHLVELLVEHQDCLYVRVAIKGTDPNMFEKLSGAKKSALKYQVRALDYCYDLGISNWPAIMSTFMDVQDAEKLTHCVAEDIDQEKLKFYPITKKSLIERGCWDMRKTPGR